MPCSHSPAPVVRNSHVQNGTAFGVTVRVPTSSSPIRNLAQPRSCGNDGWKTAQRVCVNPATGSISPILQGNGAMG